MYIIQDSEDIENDDEDDLDTNDDDIDLSDKNDDDIDLSDDDIDEENISDVKNSKTSNFEKRKFKANILNNIVFFSLKIINVTLILIYIY